MPEAGKCPENLVPFQWKKGQSGNPKGRAKKPTFEELVERILSEGKIAGLECLPREALAARFVTLLFEGNEKLLVEYLARAWPKLQKHEIQFGDISGETLEASIDRFLKSENEISSRPNGS